MSESRSILPLLTLGALCMALTGCRPPDDGPPAYSHYGHVTIFNHTNELHHLDIYALGQDMTLDCKTLALDPEAMLPDAVFTRHPPFSIQLFSGEEISVNPGDWQDNWEITQRLNYYAPCHAFLIRSPNLQDIVVFYNSSFMNYKTYYHNTGAPQELEPGEQTVVIKADYSALDEGAVPHRWRQHTCAEVAPSDRWAWPSEWGPCVSMSEEEQVEAARVPRGTRYSWRSIHRSSPLHFERPRFEMGAPIQPPARCNIPGPGKGLSWESLLPHGRLGTLTGVTRGLDGCHVITFEEAESWTVCAPYEALEGLTTRQGASTSIFELPLEEYGQPSATITLIAQATATTTRHMVLFIQGREALELSTNMSLLAEPRIGCQPREDACGEVALPVDLQVSWAKPSWERVEPGVPRITSQGTLHVVRAEVKPVVVLGCSSPVPAPEPYNPYYDPYGYGYDPYGYSDPADAGVVVFEGVLVR